MNSMARPELFTGLDIGSSAIRVVVGHADRLAVSDVERAVSGLAPLAEKKQCEIILEKSSEVIEAEFDSRRIERLLRNLLANAVEHGEGKPVTVSVGASSNAVAVSVTAVPCGNDVERSVGAMQSLPGA